MLLLLKGTDSSDAQGEPKAGEELGTPASILNPSEPFSPAVTLQPPWSPGRTELMDKASCDSSQSYPLAGSNDLL
jgi:hypothetical protein